MAKAEGKAAATVTNIQEGKPKVAPTPGKLAPLPPMPRARKSKPPKPCGCGCGEMTKGGAFIPGHDGRIKGWALRVERNVVKLKDIPEGEREAVKKFMLEKKKALAAAGKGNEKALNEETVTDAVEDEGAEPEDGGDDTEE